jgi:cell division protein ZapA
MAEVVLDIGGRQHTIACRDGSEDQVRRMGALLQQRWAAATKVSGGLSAERSMLFVALMLADTLDELQRNTAKPTPAEHPLLASVADRLESIAVALEQALPKA